MCVCVCSLLLGNPLSASGLGDCKVAMVGRHATDYKTVVRPWESGIRPTATFPRSDSYYMCMCVCVCVTTT